MCIRDSQETPRAALRGVEGKVVKRNGGLGQFARVVIDIAPRDDDAVTLSLIHI